MASREYRKETGTGRELVRELMENATQPVFRLRTLGVLRLDGDAGELLAGRRKEVALLAYLARHAGRSIPRAELAALMWGERPESNARDSLRHALMKLRSALGPALQVGTDGVALDTNAVQFDVTLFEACIAENDWPGAVALWDGDFLAAAEDVGGEAYGAWLEVERVALRRLLVSALDRLVAQCGERGDWENAAHWAALWTRARPYDEQACLRLIETLRLGGRSDQAHARHAAFAYMLQQELGHAPSLEFQRVGDILQRTEYRVEPVRPGSAALFTPDLAGRGDVFRELTLAWRAACEGGAAAVIVEGEEGIGKTRLCEEFLRAAAAEPNGALVLRCRAQHAQREALWSAARELLGGIRHAPGLGGSSADALAELTVLVPSIRDRFQTLPGATGDVAALHRAVHEILADIASEVPVILFIDDLPLADPASHDLILSLLRQPPASVCVLATIRTENDRVAAEIAELKRAGTHCIVLPALVVADMEAMLASMLQLDAADRQRLAAALQRESGGNPLYALGILSSLLDDGHVAPDAGGVWRVAAALAQQSLPLPGSVREVLARQVIRLGHTAREALDVAAVFGGRFNVALLESTAGLPRGALADGVADLMVRRFIRNAPNQTDALEFTHEAVRRTAYDLLPVARRHALHRAGAAILSDERGEHFDAQAAKYQLARTGAKIGVRRIRRRYVTAAALTIVLLSAWMFARHPWRDVPIPGDNVIAILPFRVAGADPALAYLQEGMVDLLAATLTGESGPRAADARLTIETWRRMQPQPEAEIDHANAIRFGAGLRAQQVLLGAIVGTAANVQITASVIDVATGEMRARASVSGPADSLTMLVDHMTAELLARGARETEHRVGALAGTPLPALRAYLAGQAAYRGGNYDEARERFGDALAHDSTFALATLGLVAASWWARPGDVASALAVAWPRRAALATRDRELLAAYAGPAYPGHSTMTDRVAAWETALRVAPNRPELWFEWADLLFHWGQVMGVEDWENRAITGFRRAMDLDSSFVAPIGHLMSIMATRGDSAERRRLLVRMAAQNPNGEQTDFMRWRVALTESDSATLILLRKRLDGLPVQSLFWMAPAAQHSALGLADADRAVELINLRRGDPAERMAQLIMLHTYMRNRGRRAAAEKLIHEWAQTDRGGTRHLKLELLDALYWDGDTASAARSALRLEGQLAERGAGATDVADRNADLCVLEQWRIARGTLTHTPATIASLRVRSGANPSIYDELCAALLEASLAGARGSPESADRTRRLEKLMMETGAPVAGVQRDAYLNSFLYVNLVVAQLHEARGDLPAALAALRRRPNDHVWGNVYLSSYLREEARVAAALGEQQVALKAQRHYLALR